MELIGLSGIFASLLGLALTVYGVFYNGRLTRALVEAIRQDVQAIHQDIQAMNRSVLAIHQGVQAIQEDAQKRHEDMLTYLKEMDRRHTELMAAIAQRQ